MKAHRRFSLFLFAALAVAALAFAWAGARSPFSGDAALQMRHATAYFDSVATVPADATHPRNASDAVALGYLQRLRLGVGGAFRLIAYAMADPRLDDSTGTRLAWAMLARLRSGDAYRVEPAALDDIGPGRDSTEASGAAHLALIERTVAGTHDPRAGELAIRLGYQLAAAEGTIAPDGARLAADAAALVRDRILAQRDVRTVFERARDEHLAAPVAVGRLRAAHALRVEEPTTLGSPEAAELEGMHLAAHVRDEIRALATHPATATTRPTQLDSATALRLWALGTRLPPLTPVVVALRVRPDAFPQFGGAREAENLLRRPPNEETLVAASALLGTDSLTRRESARALLRAAVQLRAYGQETPWFPGDDAPTTAEIAAALGVGVTFDPDVPDRWRGYYARMLASSIGDMTSVLGGVGFAGLRVRFGITELPDTVLAMHDPASRTIRVSIASSAGTLAHELAHDLDWQTARRLYPGVGGYSTDHAVRDERGRLGQSVRGLAAARLADPGPPGYPSNWSSRPAEVFARDVDWLVATTLAANGRSNGYLTAVQDAVLNGYASADPLDMLSGGAAALIDALDAMAFVSEPDRAAFLGRWATGHVDPNVVLDRALAMPAPPRASRLESRFGPPGAEALASSNWSCRRARPDSPGEAARHELVALAADARARGLATRWASRYAESQRPAWAWSVMGIAPWSPQLGDEMITRLRTRLSARAERGNAAAVGHAAASVPAIFGEASACATE